MNSVRIRFVGEPGEACHFIKTGPMDQMNPPVIEFGGGDIAEVQLRISEADEHCVDIKFADGTWAYQVPRDFFEELNE